MVASSYQLRLDKLRSKEIMYIDHPLFKSSDAKKLVDYDLKSDPNAYAAEALRVKRSDDDMGHYLQILNQYPVLSREAEKSLFLKYNYLKYLTRHKLDNPTKSITKTYVEEIERLISETTAVKEMIVLHNLRLVISVTKSWRTSAIKTFEDWISDGNYWLFKAADKFDISRGYKFSTYLMWAMRMNSWKRVKKTIVTKDQFDHDSDENGRPCDRSDPLLLASKSDDSQQLRTIIAKVLTSKEQWIINSRYGLGEHKELTLAEIGAALRVSKERIRQIQAKIILKLRKYL